MKSVCFDVETSGLSPVHGGRVIEIGAVAIIDGTIAAEFSTLIHVDCDIHWAAERVHGISRSMLRGQPSPSDVWTSFLDFVGGAPLIAHNARFDAGFLHFELERLGMTLSNPIQCKPASEPPQVSAPAKPPSGNSRPARPGGDPLRLPFAPGAG